MPLVNSIINWLNTKRIYHIDIFKMYPHEVQQENFFKLISHASNTTWGKQHSYGKIESVKDYQDAVRIQTYEDLEPFVERLRKGEKDLLWPGEVKWFAKSSGTTSSKSKFIPVTKEALEDCHFRGGKDVLAIYTSMNPESKIFSGKGLTLGGSHRINNFSNDSLYGDLSAILIENMPLWADLLRSPKTKIALLEDFEEKMEQITRVTINQNIKYLVGVPSWFLVLIKYILNHTGKSNLLEVWPDLELFCHGGISFKPYREQYLKIIPSQNMKYLESYNASEGYFGIQDDLGKDDMLLMLDYGIFYEFIRTDDLESDNPRALTIGEVEVGVNYAIIISTNGGLWRYMIGDTIVFTSLYPHKFKISGRTRNYINAFGEEVIIENAERALEIACSKTGAMVHEFTAGPFYMSTSATGYHEWLIEFEVAPRDPEYFTALLDNSLQSLNSDYEAKRYKNLTLNMPVVRVVPQGTFYKWFQKKNKLGGQNKVPRLANDRKYIEELYQILEESKQ
ncbi:MAG: GH3 auxin-responsive promoter family protein [Bacteroidia bacterium]|nr:MAG: GH3 auxin-responsive promoter family protein [Bacteroidia bacterium]